MKKLSIILLVILTSLVFYNCREKETKVIVQEQETTEDKGLLERVGEKADEKVNEEVDKEIEKIGDDN